MGQKGDTVLRAVVLALGLGALGAGLFKDAGVGVNVPIWAACAAFCAWYCAWRGGDSRLSTTTVVGLVLASLSAVGIGWYGSANVRVADGVALVAGLGIATLGAERVRVAAASAWDVTGRLVASVFVVLGRGLGSLDTVPWKRLGESRVTQKNTAVLRGALIATPLVLLFGALFSSADAVFDKTVRDAFSFDATQMFLWTGWAAVFSVVGLAIVGGFALPAVVKPPKEAPSMAKARVGMTETSVVLCSLCGLFGLFVAIQFRYLFGGSAAVVQTTGLTYAEYARKGFFELVWVAGLCLPLLVGAHAATRQDSKRETAVFRSLATVLAGLLFVVMASAMTRMQLYVESYGLTPLRVSVSAFMLWLALVFCWWLASLYRRSMERFAVGAVAAGFLVVGVLNVATPDVIAARYNLARFGNTADLDARHLSELGSETVPVVMANWKRLSPSARNIVGEKYRQRFSPAPDWRGATVSDLVARQVVRR